MLLLFCQKEKGEQNARRTLIIGKFISASLELRFLLYFGEYFMDVGAEFMDEGSRRKFFWPVSEKDN
jgi:hypothetical protein